MYNDGHYPYSGLGNIFDAITKAAKKVSGVAQQVEQVAGQASGVAAGRQKVAVVPTDGIYATIPVPGQPYGVTVSGTTMLLGAGAVLAAVLLLSRRR